MKFFVLISIIGSLYLESHSQTFRVDMIVERDSLFNRKRIVIKDTSKFEYYHNCSMSQGFKLKSNLPDGVYEVFVNDTFHYRAFYKEKLKDSTWTYYYPSGKISSKITYVAGKENGIYIRYREDGSVITEGYYKDGELEGFHNDFDKDGHKFRRYLFKNGEKVKQEEFYQNGNLKSEEYFSEGKFNGKNIEYFKNGKISKEIWYKADKLTRWRWYDENGKITVDKSFN